MIGINNPATKYKGGVFKMNKVNNMNPSEWKTYCVLGYALKGVIDSMDEIKKNRNMYKDIRGKVSEGKEINKVDDTPLEMSEIDEKLKLYETILSEKQAMKEDINKLMQTKGTDLFK